MQSFHGRTVTSGLPGQMLAHRLFKDAAWQRNWPEHVEGRRWDPHNVPDTARTESLAGCRSRRHSAAQAEHPIFTWPRGRQDETEGSADRQFWRATELAHSASTMDRVSVPRRRIAGIVAGALAMALIVWLVIGVIQRRADAEDRRSIYDQFALFPGARETGSERYEIRDDAGGTGEYGLRVTYELPADAASAEVIDHYRSEIPDGWAAADDHMCEVLANALPPRPTMVGPASTEPPIGYGDLGLVMLTESRLTVFTPGGSPLDDGRVDGVTFALSRVGDVKYVIADEPDFACGSAELDRDAEDFDAHQ